MSRYSLKPLPQHSDVFEVAVGWDPGLDTYFITVFGTPEVQREPEVRLWRGNVWRDLAATQELIMIAEKYAIVPADLAVTLERDRNVERQELRFPSSRVISQLLGQVPEK